MTRSTPLPDHAAEADDRAIPIDRVGIAGLAYPIQVMDRSNQWQHTVAEIDAMVGLPADVKGTHMSRFVEILNAVRGELSLRNLPDVLSEIQRRLDADDAWLEVRFPYFVSKRAPVSGAESLMSYPCAFKARKHGPTFEFTLRVGVPVTSLCPCSKAVSEYGAHNQRSLVTVELSGEEMVWIEDVVEAVEACASAPLFALLKREDEKWVTEHAYDNPRFVEDLVREVMTAVRALPHVARVRVTARNEESIHNHAAYATTTWSRDAVHGAPRLAADAADRGIASFGAWLVAQRKARGFSQQALAEGLGTSPSFLSRVEHDEKTLSTASLDRLAELLGLEPAKLKLRAGVVSPELVAKIAADPEGFLGWAQG